MALADRARGGPVPRKTRDPVRVYDQDAVELEERETNPVPEASYRYPQGRRRINLFAVAIEPEPVPLVRDQAGRFMVPNSRISLDVLVAAFKRGESPEAIHENYESVSLADVYAILSFYLRHRDEVEGYLAEQVQLGAELQARIEEIHPPDGLRAKLLARLDQ